MPISNSRILMKAVVAVIENAHGRLNSYSKNDQYHPESHKVGSIGLYTGRQYVKEFSILLFRRSRPLQVLILYIWWKIMHHVTKQYSELIKSVGRGLACIHSSGHLTLQTLIRLSAAGIQRRMTYQRINLLVQVWRW
jgi:hypothetical protein